MKKDFEIYRGKKEKVKSIALKTKKESSDDETSIFGSDDEVYAMAVRNFKKFFRRKGKFVKQPKEEKKSFRQRDEKKVKSDQKGDGIVWGCEALVKRDTPDKLQQRSVKCIFIEYLKETMGSYFYFPLKNKIVVASEIPMEAEGFEPHQEEAILIRRSVRTHRAPGRLCLNVEVKEHSLEDLNEPASYKAAMLDLESNKWIDAMNAEIQSMMDNTVWVLVDLSLNCKIVGSKWIFKKKTDMDDEERAYMKKVPYALAVGSIMYAVRCTRPDVAFAQNLVSRYQQNLGKLHWVAVKHILKYMRNTIDMFLVYEGNPDTELEVTGFCDAEATFILGIKIYRDRSKRLIGLGQNTYMDKILKRYKTNNSKRGHIPMQERLDLNKTQVRCTRPDVAFAQNITSRFQQNPGELHWTVVKNILKYLRNTKDMFLVYGGNPKAELRVDCYCDAGFETGRGDTKSQTGYVFILNGGAVE
nr:hypothetical protein [Tanacetum cinerariifolium]